jgi:hypothetical protein
VQKMNYAKRTSVSVEKSKAEIEKTLMRYGASQFAYATKPDQAVVLFQINGKRVRFNLPLPEMALFSEGKRGRKYRQEAVLKRWEQACREKWRALALVIKAKLEAVDSGITVFEEEFLAHLVTAGGRTVGERILPDLSESLKLSASVPLLPGIAE